MILRSLSAPDAEKFYTLMCTAAGRELPKRRRSRRRWPKRWSRLGGASCWPLRDRRRWALPTPKCVSFSECAPVGVIHEFYVREDARGRNVGSAMLVSLTTQFKAAGCVSVQASCARVNLKSQEFLEKRGFVKHATPFSRPFQG